MFPEIHLGLLRVEPHSARPARPDLVGLWFECHIGVGGEARFASAMLDTQER